MSENEFVTEWIKKADEDCNAASYLLNAEHSFLSTICFLLQQASEKYLKALLTYNNFDFQKTHNINYLLNACAHFYPEFSSIDPKNFNDFAVDIRYLQFDFQITQNEINEYFIITEQIKNLVKNNLNII